MTTVPESGGTSAVDVLASVVEAGGSLQAMCMLASAYLERGAHDKALHYASLAVAQQPASVQARDVLAKVFVALGDYPSAQNHFDALAILGAEHPVPRPDQRSIPAHFALHNVEQLQHLLGRDVELPVDVTADELRSLRSDLVEFIDAADGSAPWVSVDGRSSQILAELPFVKVAETPLPSYLNAAVDYAPIRQDITAGRLQAQVIDDFLTPEALEQVRKFCLESTVWRRPYRFGYVGAFPEHGFASPALFAITEEFSAALGEAFDGYHLAQWWAFVYDAKLPGTDIHGDDADFSLNLWITPDSANLDPHGGGLVVWDTTAPSDWSYDDYNSGGARVTQFLDDHDAQSHVIPYRENRAVLFKGHLFHRTDDFSFAPGFTNRRRSVTFLFRRRPQ